jgi:hypothetical protein
MSNAHSQMQVRTLRKQREWNPRAVAVAEHNGASRGEQGERPISVTTLILFLGVAGELVIPWVVIWLSNVFLFDVPPWLTWLSFGGPLGIGLFAMLAYWTLGAWGSLAADGLCHAHAGRR